MSCAFDEGGGALVFELSQVFQVGDAVIRFEERERLTGREIIALPAATKFLLSRTVSDLPIRWAAIAPAGPLAPQLHHRAQEAVALVVVLEFLEEGHVCHQFRHLVEPMPPEFFSQISGQIRHRLRVAGAIPAIQPAIADQILFLRHLDTPSQRGHSLV